jgi:GT2 family glycosyltransferase
MNKISVVCSTIKPNPKFKEHVIEKSGLKNEDIDFVFYENNNQYSLTEVYDKALKEAKHDIIVFLHDDIQIKNQKWGVKLLNHFNTSDYGIIGVAGTTEIGASGTWWDKFNLMVGIVEHKQDNKTHTSKYCKNFGDKIIQTVMVDGLFFAVDRKKIVYNFDKTIPGFHFYDVDFTFGNHINGVKVGVIFDIRILHNSVGKVNEQWNVNRLNFVNKWTTLLQEKIKGEIFYDEPSINLKLEPKLALIILNKSNNDILFKCLDSIKSKTRYNNFKIYIGDTGSTNEELESIDEYIKGKNITLHNIGKYNFGANNNKIVNEIIDKDTDILLFCNNDVELINDTISIMVDFYLKNIAVVGTIGCRLHYPNNTIQHAGVDLLYFRKDNAVHITHHGLNSYYNYTDDTDVFGSTGAFLMINEKLFNSVGQFNENYEDCFEDVELNIRMLLKNRKNYVLTSACAYHHESLTRNLDDKKIDKLNRDYKERLLPLIINNQNKLIKYFKVV